MMRAYAARIEDPLQAHGEAADLARQAAGILMCALKHLQVPPRELDFLRKQIDFNIDWGHRLTRRPGEDGENG